VQQELCWREYSLKTSVEHEAPGAIKKYASAEHVIFGGVGWI
jgi:hypothetical protein